MMVVIKTKYKLLTKTINGLRAVGNLMLLSLIGQLKSDKISSLVVLVLEVEVYTSKELSN